MTNLKEKTALVTGGSRGIGRAIAIELARAGATVSINFQKNKREAEVVLAELRQISSQSHSMVPFNISVGEEVERGIESAEKLSGPIDILVNNAGIARDNLLLRMKESEWDEVIAVNLKGVFNCSKVVARGMLKRKKGGRIINISSLSGVMGNPGQANYAASKAAVIGLTKSLAKELASRLITVNAVAPGFMETDMTSQLNQVLKEEVIKQIPLGRFGSCEEVAHLVVFLASEQSRYITGQVMGVNGGLYM